MFRFLHGSMALLLLSGAICTAQPQPAKQAEPAGKLVVNLWDAAYLNGARAGYIHTTVRELERDGKKLFQYDAALELTIKRFEDTIRTQLATGTLESPDGKVSAVSMSQTAGKTMRLDLVGTVDGDQLKVKVSGNQKMEKAIRWDDKVIGLYKEHLLFKEKQVKAGDTFSYQHYEPIINAVVTVQVAVKDFEDVEIDKSKKKLLRVESRPDKIAGIQLPPTTFWLDKDLLPVRSQMEMAGMGQLVLVRATREQALAPVTGAKMSDIGLTTLIPLNRPIPRPHSLSSITYKVTIPGDDEPSKALPTDNRQEIKNIKGKSFDLIVKAVRKPEPQKTPAEVPEEFTKSNHFVNSADELVQKLAKRAVGEEKDPWKKAQRIEKWVHDNMKPRSYSEHMATADQVARTLEGDCTNHAMLCAAMCRAAGVPSRTALGLVYSDRAFAYHMWTEVNIGGQWLAIDATLGMGSVGAAHIKITDHSWQDTRSLAPLLPVMRVMLGKTAIEVIQIEGAD